jgi:hypothetical protein
MGPETKVLVVWVERYDDIGRLTSSGVPLKLTSIGSHFGSL